jgi:hypothetical protein
MSCVSLRLSAAAIRASSCVNLSNRFRASPMPESFLHTSFLKYFSENTKVNQTVICCLKQRTRSTLLHFLGRNRKDV